MDLHSAKSVSAFKLRMFVVTAILTLVGCTAEPANNALNQVTRAASAASVLPDPNPGQPSTAPKDEPGLRARLVALINDARAKSHVDEVRPAETLMQIADYHTSRMIDGNFFAHVDPYDRSTASARAGKFDYPFIKIGENLAAGQDAPEQVVAEWLASEAHRKVLLDADFREAGVGVLDGGRYGRYWTLILGTRAGQ